MHHQLLRDRELRKVVRVPTRGWGPLLGWVLLAGCSASGAQPLESERQAVLGGEPTGASHAGVLYVTSEVRNVGGTAIVKIGSSALIAPNLLVTALHVVSQNPSNVPFTCDNSGSATSGSSGASLGALVSPEKVLVYAGPEPTGEPLARGQRILSTGSTTICQNDLAFVVLDESLDLPTYRVHRGDPMALGDALTVVGYGSGLSSTQETSVRSARGVDVVAVGQWIRTFTVSLGPCEGDSGGPALSRSGELVGIFSSVARDCLVQGAAPKYTDVSYFSRLVEEAFDAAGAGSPWAAPSEGEGGAGGASEAEQSGAPSVGGEPSAPPPAPPPEERERDSSCSTSSKPRGESSSLAAWLALGAALVSLRVGSRRRT
jgi:Trypsin-like peptidase domain